MNGMARLAAALIFGIVVPAGRAEAQDTSFMDMNMNMGCMLMAGMHKMQVSIYQSGATEDACPDLPFPGQTVVSLTATSNELRDLTAEVRIVRGGGVDAAAKDALDPITLAYLPPKTYPTGIITIPANFDGPGKYTVLLTVSDGKEMSMSGHLEVTVAQGTRKWIFVFGISGIIVAAAFGYYFWDLKRNKKILAKT